MKVDSIVEEVKSQIFRVLSSDAVTNLESLGAKGEVSNGSIMTFELMRIVESWLEIVYCAFVVGCNKPVLPI